jgi:NAD-dependent SIR2 family protein deacetylase
LKENKFKKIVFLTGAGISVSAGIPDFRSKDTGLYAQLAKYNLPQPEAIFGLDYFKEKPEAFYELAKTFLDLDKFNPTPAHHFANLLLQKGMVSHYLTQNIDDLESKAGFKPEEVVQAHGANFGATCSFCKRKCSREKLIECIQAGKVMYCGQTQGEGKKC